MQTCSRLQERRRACRVPRGGEGEGGVASLTQEAAAALPTPDALAVAWGDGWGRRRQLDFWAQLIGADGLWQPEQGTLLERLAEVRERLHDTRLAGQLDCQALTALLQVPRLAAQPRVSPTPQRPMAWEAGPGAVRCPLFASPPVLRMTKHGERQCCWPFRARDGEGVV